ncbi:DciA family protein [Luteimonas salinilitoris]|uniref:DciA family protein n=1 Tax=Luteimonas salinilitoris TaxID=3237697 RepID=A0ABV4HNE4_9GAMM
MSGSRSKPPAGTARAAPAQPALDALLKGAAGDPLRRALWLDALDQQLRPLLPPPLAAHARLGNVDGRRLVYLVDAPVWHARMRLAGPELLDGARSIGLDVTEFVVKTTRPMPRPPQSASTSRPMSARADAALRDALALLADDDPGKDTS